MGARVWVGGWGVGVAMWKSGREGSGLRAGVWEFGVRVRVCGFCVRVREGVLGARAGV